MKRLALIQNSRVENVIVWDGIETLITDGYTVVDVTSMNVAPGWSYNGSSFQAPATLNMSVVRTLGSSANVPVVQFDNYGGQSYSSVALDKLYDHWHGTTQYAQSQLRKYTNVLSTDSNGRITVNLTQNGAAGGTALFSSVLSYSVIGFDPSGVSGNAPTFIIESSSATQVVFRAIKGTTTLISVLGANVLSTQYAAAGVSAAVKVIGVK